MTNAVIYDMGSFWEQCVARYVEVAGPGVKVKEVNTSFLIDEGNHDLARDLVTGDLPCCAWCGYVDGAISSTVAVSTFREDSSTPEANGQPGYVVDTAARALMNILYAARMARFDLLSPVQELAFLFVFFCK